MAIIPILNNQQLDEMEKARQAATTPATPINPMTGLASYVRTAWTKAYEHKSSIQLQLLKNLRSFNNEYPPEDLAAIRSLGGSEQYLSLTPTKCVAAISWLADIFDNPSGRPWDIDPTASPTIPADMEQEIRTQVIQEVSQVVNSYATMTQQDPRVMMKNLLPSVRKRVRNKIKEKAKEGIDELKELMEDQLQEGGWYPAFSHCLFDLVVYKASILKGPIFRKRRQFSRIEDQIAGGFENNIEDVVVPMFERRTPFNIYPSPDATNVQDSYLCDLDSLTLKKLYGLIGVEGFNEAAIRRVIETHKTGGLREWATTNSEIIRLESGGQRTIFDTDKIDVVEFWGDVPGALLLDEGLSPDEITDPLKRYDVCVWLIGGEVIKAMLNPNPMGLKPYTVRSYVTIPGSFWGRGLPELIADLQQICNAITRAIVNNAALSSGPVIETDSDRVPGVFGGLYPWKHIESTDKQMSGGPAVRFYQPQTTADLLTRVLQFFIRLADQYSIPSYAHGDVNVGGGAETASGLSMLMSSANRVVKKVVKNADDMIKDSMELLFYYNIYYNADQLSFIGDVNIVAKGVNSMLREEQQAVRRTEFLVATNNPADLEIMGMEGRKELLREVAITLDVDGLSRIFPEIDEIDGLRVELEQLVAQQMEALQPTLMATPEGEKGKAPAKKRALDLAGNVRSGQDNRLIPQKSMEPKR